MSRRPLNSVSPYSSLRHSTTPTFIPPPCRSCADHVLRRVTCATWETKPHRVPLLLFPNNRTIQWPNLQGKVLYRIEYWYVTPCSFRSHNSNCNVTKDEKNFICVLHIAQTELGIKCSIPDRGVGTFLFTTEWISGLMKLSLWGSVAEIRRYQQLIKHLLFCLNFQRQHSCVVDCKFQPNDVWWLLNSNYLLEWWIEPQYEPYWMEADLWSLQIFVQMGWEK
jgi:hypothetical protein